VRGVLRWRTIRPPHSSEGTSEITEDELRDRIFPTAPHPRGGESSRRPARTSSGSKTSLKDAAVIARLHRLGSLFLSDSSKLEPILLEIVDAAIDITRSDFGNIQLLDATSADLRIVAQRGFPQWWLDFWNKVSAGQGTCGTALERGERVVVDDVEQSPIFVGTPALEVQQRVGVRAVVSTPLYSRSGRPIGMFSTHFRSPHRPDQQTLQHLDLLARHAADIVERARAEEALRESEARFRTLAEERGELVRRLEETVRFAEQFVGILGHDLRNPLNAIRLSANLLKSASTPAAQVMAIDRILSSSANMAEMVNQLLDLTRCRLAGGIAIDRKATVLDEIVTNVVDELRLVHPSRDIRSELAANVRGAWDPGRLRQVVSNLLDNALRHGDPSRHVEVRLAAQHHQAVLDVRSFGPPILPELMPVLFDPYRRGKIRDHGAKGLGLGLFISHQIVTAHGGRIDVESNAKSGNTFTVRLPGRQRSQRSRGR
jgi:signal transduction histidine kinase